METMEEATMTPTSNSNNSPSKLSPEASRLIEEKRRAARELLKRKRLEGSTGTEETPHGPGSSSSSEVKVKQPKLTDEARVRYEELLGVVKRGTAVQVSGSKCIDTGGGFLLEASDYAEAGFQVEAPPQVVVEPAPLIPTESPICDQCGVPFSSSFLLSNYDYPVCDACRDPDGEHAFITRTDAKTEFLLKDEDLDRREPILRFLSRPNPHNPRWGDMKLYLRPQIIKRAIEVWGSLNVIEEQRELREDNRAKTKVKKYNKKLKSLRMVARSSLYTRDLTPHVHKWGSESYDEEEDTYSHTCIECNQVENYEKM